jgi:hypothetical protein
VKTATMATTARPEFTREEDQRPACGSDSSGEGSVVHQPDPRAVLATSTVLYSPNHAHTHARTQVTAVSPVSE